nr:hypothetical protein KitaXyl93_16190 [Kitasatospora sp. Xyl93]
MAGRSVTKVPCRIVPIWGMLAWKPGSGECFRTTVRPLPACGGGLRAADPWGGAGASGGGAVEVAVESDGGPRPA